MNRIIYPLLCILLTSGCMKPGKARISDYGPLVAIQGTLTPAAMLYKDPAPAEMEAQQAQKFEQERRLFQAAAGSYNRAHDLWGIHLQAIALNEGKTYTLRQYRTALDKALADMTELQRARGIQP